jgi:hypothetical protein
LATKDTHIAEQSLVGAPLAEVDVEETVEVQQALALLRGVQLLVVIGDSRSVLSSTDAA